MKKEIETLLRFCDKENIEDLISYMNRNGFYARSCHHHHRYDGGLADHAMQTCRFALNQWQKDCHAGNHAAQQTTEESIIISSLLHDMCDTGGLHRFKGHGYRSAAMIRELGVNLTHEEFLAIRFHMSLKGKEKSRFYQEACKSYLRHLIHQADGESARRHHGNTIS